MVEESLSNDVNQAIKKLSSINLDYSDIPEIHKNEDLQLFELSLGSPEILPLSNGNPNPVSKEEKTNTFNGIKNLIKIIEADSSDYNPDF